MDLKKYFEVGPVFTYFFRKKDPSKPKNFNLKVMHGINKLSILMFLAALLLIVLRLIFRD